MLCKGRIFSAVAVKCTISSTAYLMPLKYYLPQQGYYEDLVQHYNMQNMSNLLQHIIFLFEAIIFTFFQVK